MEGPTECSPCKEDQPPFEMLNWCALKNGLKFYILKQRFAVHACKDTSLIKCQWVVLPDGLLLTVHPCHVVHSCPMCVSWGSMGSGALCTVEVQAAQSA